MVGKPFGLSAVWSLKIIVNDSLLLLLQWFNLLIGEMVKNC